MTESTAKAHRTVGRVTSILECVARQPGMRLHELSVALDAPKSSVFGLVKGLVSTGYLVEADGAYRLGPALGNLLTGGLPGIATAARPALEELRRRFGETVMLGAAVGDSLIYVDAVESEQPIRYSAPLRTRRPLYPPSAGKIFLAYWSARRREAYLKSVLPDAERVQAAMNELDTVRAEGVALNRGETLPDVSAAARPILVDGEVVAAIAVAGPTTRISGRLPEIGEALAGITAAVVKRWEAARQG
ncbi:MULTISPECIES: IclR family transcriptional regulator [Amycolatopsis]|uniref:IclR family transcriptional regulator n=1 Tax=Amycolatopsis dendrobii TaxID=2760662 RepID=A0A7W3VY07_9PSEU|nr:MULTISPECIES: IclR family transcriptional regulator [Amycolatopsis]MBB1154777.1 IclR family transcriptional regulator [Amycolatopsis dendrobii]UKD56410.1 IclR family transcriptional regulator [Amycolatopsis sp. FU40]